MRGSTKLAVAALLLTTDCTTARVHLDEPLAPSGADRSSNLFAFHSNFWVNLHHRLYEESARLKPPGPLDATGAGPSSYSSDKPEWRAAIDFYRSRFSKRESTSLLSDAQLVRINYRLAGRDLAPSLDGSELDPDLTAQLEAAARVYRAGAWAEDDQRNRQWIESLKRRLDAFGAGLSHDVTSVYAAPWPETIKVDVSAFAGPAGAYTLLTPVLITVGSEDSRNSGDAALEVVFHEASHALIPSVKRTLEEQCRAQQKDPGDLWHALLFYTTGEVARRRLGPNYVPYAARNGLYATLPRWDRFEQVLARDWQLYLDGDVDMERALAKMVEDL